MVYPLLPVFLTQGELLAPVLLTLVLFPKRAMRPPQLFLLLTLIGQLAALLLAGGTLGILIPPSVLLIVYGMVDNSSIGQLWTMRDALNEYSTMTAIGSSADTIAAVVPYTPSFWTP